MKILSRLAVPAVAVALAVSGATFTLPAQAGIPASQQAADTPRAVVTDPVTASGLNRPAGQQAPSWASIVDGDRGRLREIWAYSPSMKRQIPLFVIAPADNSVPRPIVYVLNGGDGGEGRANWVYQTDIVDFYRDKNVWVVIPMAGQFSYYSDWEESVDALGGVQKWETFMTKELPEPLEAQLGASSKRGIIGMSMTGTTTLLYAEHHPGFYDAVGSFSGCAETSRGLPLEYLRITLNRGGANPTQMWGPIGGKTFLDNDALLNAERLRGTPHIYVSSGTGLAGPYDLWNTTFTNADSGAVFVHVVNGGIIEAATNKCTHDLKAKTDKLGIDVDYNLRPVGTHSWGYWQLDLRDSWPTFARAFDMDPGAPTPMNAEVPAPISPDTIRDIWRATLGDDPRLAPGAPLPLSPADGGDRAPLAPAPAPNAPAAPAEPAQPAPAPAPENAPAPAPAPAEPAPAPQPAPAPAPAPEQPAAPPAAPAEPAQPAPAPAPAEGATVGAPLRFSVPAINF